MASSGSRAQPVKRLKKGTETKKSHRFEPFSQRIAKLKIDPIHRVRGTGIGYTDKQSDVTASHFKESLDHWVDLNLSRNFSDFVRLVGSLCESLPQLLYHEDKVMALLVEYIEKRDQLSMEPLLSLLSQFARDLGVRFEKHFATSVKLIASVAATHQSIDVVEWSFACLAWIFKFLSRLLVPDLRQLLDIMAPYLGKDHQKPFVSRFAAESMSFLVRKATLIYHKDKLPLQRAVSFLFSDLRSNSGTRNVEEYKRGIMSMFSDAIRGVKGCVHSSACDIFRCLFDRTAVGDDEEFALTLEIVGGIVINIIHYVTAETFDDVVNVMFTYIHTEPEKCVYRHAQFSSLLIFLIINTRKGTRVKDWKKVHEALLLLLQRAAMDASIFQSRLPHLLTATAAAFQHSPMDELLPLMRPIMETMTTDALSSYFLAFCSAFSALGSERFHIIVLPYFQRFISSFWERKEEDICYAILRLREKGSITPEAAMTGYITAPAGWKAHIHKNLNNSSSHQIPLMFAYSKLPVAISLFNEPSLLPALSQHLKVLFISASRELSANEKLITIFSCGQGFRAYVSLAIQCGDLDPALWNAILSIACRQANLPVFLEGILEYIIACRGAIDLSDDKTGPLRNSLIRNLTSPSGSLRLLSLKLLEQLIAISTIEDFSPIAIAIDIEESPLTLQSARYLSMQVRKLGFMYKQFESDRWINEIIPNYCFGLFSKKLSQLWGDSVEALKSIAEHTTGENVISDLAFSWLQSSSVANDDEQDPREAGKSAQTSSPFECFNVLNVKNILESEFLEQNPLGSLQEMLDQEHKACELVPAYSKSHALRVLSAIPQIAEKRSRQFIPLFLSWAVLEEDVTTRSDHDSQHSLSLSANIAGHEWGYKDRLSFIGILAMFLNPKVLFKSIEVHHALLDLTANGDSEIQKAALKALFTWKSPSILPYRENLLNLLDESRFREELASFVHVGREDSVIEDSHKKELLPVLLRLLYGRIVSRASASSNRGGQSGRRKAVLRTLSHLPDRDFELFITIAFGPLKDMTFVENGCVMRECFDQCIMSLKRQSGLLKMFETMFDSLQTRLLNFTERSMQATLYCLVRATRRSVEMDAINELDFESSKALSALRDIRQVGIRCLDLIFSVSPTKDWSLYIPLIFDEIINVRLQKFTIENSQGVSGLHKLFHTWAASPVSAKYLVQFNNTLLPTLYDSLTFKSTKDEVKIFVIDQIQMALIGHVVPNETKSQEAINHEEALQIRNEIISPHIHLFLSHINRLLQEGPALPLLVSAVESISSIAPFIESPQETASILTTASFLLRQSSERISPKTKSGLLRILRQFLSQYAPNQNDDLIIDIFMTITSLFNFFKDNKNRAVLSEVFEELAAYVPELAEVSPLCADLNAISKHTLDEVDYDRRLQAFARINEELWSSLSANQWRPLMFNMLFYIRDEEELAIRASASFALRRFIERAAQERGKEGDGFGELVQEHVFPALQNGMRHKVELIRSEFVSVLGHFVKLNPEMASVQDMHDLLMQGDDEASFFTNIMHIQQHRRLRALRRLTSEASKGNLQASNISTLFMPLIEHFILTPAQGEQAHNLAAESVASIGRLSEWLDWPQFRAIFRRYRGYMESKPELEKNTIRILGKMTDALSSAMVQNVSSDTKRTDTLEEAERTKPLKCRLATSLPSIAKLSTELTSNFIPFLSSFVHHKDETQMSLRLPVAVTAIKMLKLLPEENMALLLSPILLDVCNVLKSRAQDSRDTARKTLAEIAIILGPTHFGYILKELRTVLTKGYQLHVISFTVHSLLVSTTDIFAQGDLDMCLADLATIVMDDIFGVTGQEKDAEEYVSKMKEVKSSKSYDSMELLAKNSSISQLGKLTEPLQLLLREKLSLNIVKKVDELLRRLGVGLLRNPGAESRDLLVFCFEIIKESCQDNTAPIQTPTMPAWKKKYLINVRGARGEKKGLTSSYTYKLGRLGLDVLRSTLNKFNSLMTPTNLAGFLPIIGDAMVGKQEENKISAMRLLSTIIKVPLSALDRDSNVYLAEAIKLIKEAPSTNSEAAQAALKLIGAILRERKTTTLKDTHLAYLLKRLSTDIEEPDRQGVTFNFIRAVMERKFVVPEIYELVDNIAAMMITNQTRSARDLARGTYVYFLIEYPQAKHRWTKQISFLTKNLEYQHREGRESVMEAIHMLFSKTGGDLAQEIIMAFFLPLLLVVANDETSECRQMAGALLGELFRRAEAEQVQLMLKLVRSWLEQTENMQLVSTGLQAMRIFFEVQPTGKDKDSWFITEVLPAIVHPIIADPGSEYWEVLYFALQLFNKVCKSSPTVALSQNCSNLWSGIRDALFYPHAWIKTCSANLIGLWLSNLAKAHASSRFEALPLITECGLPLDGDSMIQLVRGSFRSLSSLAVSEELALQSVRNIVFLSRCFAANNLEVIRHQKNDLEEDDDEDIKSGSDSEGSVNGESPRFLTGMGSINSNKSAIHYIFEQISRILRRETISRTAGSMISKTSSMSLLAAVCRHLDVEKLLPSLHVVLMPLYHLTDSSIPAPRSNDAAFQRTYTSLVSTAQEVLDLLQKKFGTTEYVAQMASVQEYVRNKREGRRKKRRIEAVADPERFVREKKRRNDRKKEKRREMGLEFRGRRRGW